MKIKIEEVKKIRDIISDARLTAYQDGKAGVIAFRIGNMEYEKRICQLFEKEAGKLLSFEEVKQIYELWDMATDLIDIDLKESFSKTVGRFWNLVDFGMMVAVEQQELANPIGIEPKPDESRLLTYKEMVRAFKEAKLSPFANPHQERCVIARTQRDLTASIKDAECQQRVRQEIMGIYCMEDIADIRKAITALVYSLKKQEGMGD